MAKRIKIHNHPHLESELEVPKGHVIIDTDLYFELLQRFGNTLPFEKQNPYEKESTDGN
jgi:hypothetical protein